MNLHLWKYSILHRLKRGLSISISPTFRCNYTCDYCTLRIAIDNPRKPKESTLEEWLHLVDQFPYKVKEVHITGGEPTLMPYTNGLIMELINRRTLVALFTNLSHDITVPPSPYFRIDASYHKQADETTFKTRLEALRRAGHQITVDEVGYRRATFKTNVKRQLHTVEDLETVKPRIRFAPDRTAYFTTCYDMYLK